MANSNYSELLKDPRWQKLRLEIFERDKWKCCECGNEKKTLHVHHLRYHSGFMPWEYDESDLITLCCDCHEEQRGETRQHQIEWINEILPEFSTKNLKLLGCFISDLTEREKQFGRNTLIKFFRDTFGWDPKGEKNLNKALKGKWSK